MTTTIVDLGADRTAEAAAESDDLRLAEALRRGDESAYEELLNRFQQPVYNLAIRLLGDSTEAADVVQEVFLKVFRNIGSFRGHSTLKTWIYRITVNEAHNARRWFFRHRRREIELDNNPDDTRQWKEAIPDRRRSPYEVAFEREQHRHDRSGAEPPEPHLPRSRRIAGYHWIELRGNRGNPECFVRDR